MWTEIELSQALELFSTFGLPLIKDGESGNASYRGSIWIAPLID